MVMKKLYSVPVILLVFTLTMCGGPKSSKSEAGDTSYSNPESEEFSKTPWPPEQFKEGVEIDLKRTGVKNYYIIFDGSGSMAGEKIEIAKKALIRFIKVIPDKGNIGLTSFDASGFFERAPLGSSKRDIIKQVEKIMAGGNTPLGGCIDIAYEKLGIQAASQMGYGEYNLVIITDGEATDGSRMGYAVDRLLNETPVVIYTIGLRIGEGHALNQPGKILYKPADNYEELSKGLESVLAETEDFIVMDFNK
jgi:uncharacterized protein YegL